MTLLKSILLQASLMVCAGLLLGLGVNLAADTPLPLIRVPLPPAEETWATVDAETVLQHVEDGSALLIDARDPNEYQAGHLPGALNLPDTTFAQTFTELGDSLPREVPLIVYCQGGPCDQSHHVLEDLSRFDFQNLILYPGGWNEWKQKGYPVEP